MPTNDNVKELPKESIIIAASTVGVASDISENVLNSVHLHDAMFANNKTPEAYFKSGAQALKAIQASLLLSQNSEPKTILDFGCGHGRVGRWLRAAYPEASLTGAEIIPSTISFYADMLAADMWHTKPNVSLNQTNKKFDLIWAGSVITHLTEEDASLLIKKFTSWLNPKGIAIFSTHGRSATNVFRDPPPRIETEGLHTAIQDYKNDRYGYTNYNNETNYGLSFTPAKWILQQANEVDRRLITFSEGGWNGFQDIVTIQRTIAYNNV